MALLIGLRMWSQANIEHSQATEKTYLDTFMGTESNKYWTGKDRVVLTLSTDTSTHTVADIHAEANLDTGCWN